MNITDKMITPQMIRDTGAWSQSEDDLRDTLKLAADALTAALSHPPVEPGDQAPENHLQAACEGIADDYMTSAAHHPGWVLIPQAKFDEICAALATEGSAE